MSPQEIANQARQFAEGHNYVAVDKLAECHGSWVIQFKSPPGQGDISRYVKLGLTPSTDQREDPSYEVEVVAGAERGENYYSEPIVTFIASEATVGPLLSASMDSAIQKLESVTAEELDKTYAERFSNRGQADAHGAD